MDFYAIVQQCGNHFQEREVYSAIAKTESGFNPYAIGVVNGAIKQPKTLQEAIEAVRQLKAKGYNYSVGLMQINQVNFGKFGLNEQTMFDPCTNIRVGGSILRECYDRAERIYGGKYSYDSKLKFASSCYYSGNFKTGFKADFKGQPPYVVKFFNNLTKYRGGVQQQQLAYTYTPQQPTLANVQPTQVNTQAIVAQEYVKRESPYKDLVRQIQEQRQAMQEQEQLAQTIDNSEPLEDEPMNDVVLTHNSDKTNSWDVFKHSSSTL